MQYRSLGNSGLKVSTLCLGTMTFGEADAGSMMHNVGSPEDVAHDVLVRAMELGVNFIDTADVYGNDGLSERVIGDFFRKWGRRDELVLATKFRFRMSPGPLGTGASRRRIVAACEASLKRLNTDRIDLYQIHCQDMDTPEEETLRALDDLVRQGKVLYIGASNYAAYRLVDSLWTSRDQRLERFVSLQAQYSLAVRDLERELAPACTKFGLGILPWSPLGGGFLSGKYRRNQPPPEGSRLAEWKARYAAWDTERNWKILDAVLEVADATGSTPTAVALAWLLRRPAVTSVVFGARDVGQLEANVAAADLVLSDDAMAKLEAASAIQPGYPYEFIQRVCGSW